MALPPRLNRTRLIVYRFLLRPSRVRVAYEAAVLPWRHCRLNVSETGARVVLLFAVSAFKPNGSKRISSGIH